MEEIFVLGASDPEMRRISELLVSTNRRCLQATKDGIPVHPGSAYYANNSKDSFPVGSKIIFIECEVEGVVPDVIIDHHYPGDPGYDKGPALFWEASSLGQLYGYLGMEPTTRDKVLAAMDHCYNAAMKDECPGISAKEVHKLKIEEIAKGTGSSPEDVRKKIEYFCGVISISRRIPMGEQSVYELAENVGVGYTLSFLAAQVAAVIQKCAVIIHRYNEEGGPEKLSLRGDVAPETVEYFMKVWAPAHNLHGIYGSPYRGYAGATKK